MVYAKRIDTNQIEIVKVFRQMGALVHISSGMGEGFPDAVICVSGHIHLVEIKDGSRPPSQQRLTPAESKFHERWPVTIIRSVDDAIKFIASLRIAVNDRQV